MENINWQDSHPGVFHCPIVAAMALQPEITEPLNQLINSGNLEFPTSEYLVDSKVMMLMPNQYPCIPNWHFDFIPRDENLKEQPELRNGKKMFLWLSGEPFTEFKDGRKVEAQKWISFTQYDEHRGVKSEKFQWRCFIRVSPKEYLEEVHPRKWLRRHTQVYLDTQNFKW